MVLWLVTANGFKHVYFQTYMGGWSQPNNIFTVQPTYIHACMHAYIRTYVRTYKHTYIQTYIHTYINTYIHTYICICIHVVKQQQQQQQQQQQSNITHTNQSFKYRRRHTLKKPRVIGIGAARGHCFLPPASGPDLLGGGAWSIHSPGIEWFDKGDIKQNEPKWDMESPLW